MSDIDRIQADIDAERAALNAMLDHLSDRLEPRALASEAARTSVAVGEEMAAGAIEGLRGAGRSAITNTVISVALDWLSQSKHNPKTNPAAHVRSTRHATSAAQTTEEDPMTTYHPMDADTHSDSRLAKLQRDAQNLRERITEGTEELSEEARAKVIAARHRAIEAADKATTQAREKAREARSFVRENPLVVGGAAVAIGAAIAGLAMWRARDNQSGDPADDVYNPFSEADRVLEDERAKAAAVRNSSVFGADEDDAPKDVRAN